MENGSRRMVHPVAVIILGFAQMYVEIMLNLISQVRITSVWRIILNVDTFDYTFENILKNGVSEK